MTEEMPVRETVAQKRAPQKQNLIYGCIIAALAVFAAASAAFNAKNGAGLVVFGILLAVLAGGFSAYCFALYFAQKKLPDVLIYAEGDGLFCYRHKEKDYERIPLSDIVSVEGGITAREVRSGLLRIRTAEKKTEIYEILQPFAAREKIAELRIAQRERTGGGNDEM